MNVTITKSEDGKTLLAAVCGNIDTTTAGEFQDALLKDIAGMDAVELDFTQVEYISSAGLRVLLKLVQSCPEITLHSPNPAVRDVLEMTGMNSILKIA